MFINTEMSRKELDCLYDIAKDCIDFGTLHESYETVFEELCKNIQGMEKDDFYLDFKIENDCAFVLKGLDYYIDWESIKKEDEKLVESVIAKIEEVAISAWLKLSPGAKQYCL